MQSAEAPPEVKEAPSVRADCICAEEIAADVVILEGLVVDAEVTLGPDGRSPNERQATVFDIWRAQGAEISGRTRVWHSSNKKSCGIVFDYGRKYSLAVQRNAETGDLETDACLMRAARAS